MAKDKLDRNNFTRAELDAILLEAGRRQMVEPAGKLVTRQEIQSMAGDANYNLTHIIEAMDVVLEQRQVKHKRNSFIRKGIGMLAAVAVLAGAYFGKRVYDSNNQIEARVLEQSLSNNDFSCKYLGAHYQLNVVDAKGVEYSLQIRTPNDLFSDVTGRTIKACDYVKNFSTKIHKDSIIQFPQSGVEDMGLVYLDYTDVKIVK